MGNKKWSELSYDNHIVRSDESRQAVLGAFLVSLGIDLERLPNNLFEPYGYFQTSQKDYNSINRSAPFEKIYLQDIVGTSYEMYAEDNQVLYSFMKLKRITDRILCGKLTPNKYFHMMKKPYQTPTIVLSRNTDGTYYVDGNGNHRVLSYKIMMLAEIASKYDWVYSDDYGLTYKGFTDVTKKYWLYARINED